ncbi:MAG: hypothetical protein SFY32_10060 [Bacteroidota bacterium]|nr:hypothetical protein [Bacteroidota bacterium]
MSEVQELVLNKWELLCWHTPETIDRIMLNIRKRGMMLESLDYKKIDAERAICVITFEDTWTSANRIFSNMQRIEDLIEIKRLD